MFGKGLYQQEESLLRDIMRSIDKKMDYTTREGDGSRFTLHLTLRGHKSEVTLDLDDLKVAQNDMAKRHQIRQKIKAKYDHLDKSRYGADILGFKSARILRASPKPEPVAQRGFGRSTRR
jgi:polyisoprenoid-binding protein YceI